MRALLLALLALLAAVVALLLLAERPAGQHVAPTPVTPMTVAPAQPRSVP